MKATTTYKADRHGRGRILVQWTDGQRRQRTITYDQSVHDPHAAVLLEVFGDNATLTENEREAEPWPNRRSWTVRTAI